MHSLVKFTHTKEYCVLSLYLALLVLMRLLRSWSFRVPTLERVCVNSRRRFHGDQNSFAPEAKSKGKLWVQYCACASPVHMNTKIGSLDNIHPSVHHTALRVNERLVQVQSIQVDGNLGDEHTGWHPQTPTKGHLGSHRGGKLEPKPIHTKLFGQNMKSQPADRHADDDDDDDDDSRSLNSYCNNQACARRVEETVDDFVLYESDSCKRAILKLLKEPPSFVDCCRYCKVTVLYSVCVNPK